MAKEREVMMPKDEYEYIQIHDKGNIRWIGLNRKESRNALNAQLLQEFVFACEKANDDEAVGAIIIYSCLSNVFSAGADLKERQGMDDIQVKHRRRFARDCYERLERIDKIMIAAVDGKVIGGGNEILGCCDIVFASDKSTFRYVEVLVGSVGATQRLTQAVGKQRAKELMFTGREIDSKEAYAIGLIARYCVSDNFYEEIQKTAEVIASRNPVTLCMSKKAINMAFEAAPEQGMLMEQVCIELNLALGNPSKGLTDFVAGKTTVRG
jgi:enoyl-CoA hydratase